jgi:hypothetical protein
MTSAAEKKTEDWMTTKWRPLMAITYMATIWFDFIVGPIIFNILQYYNPGQAVTSWTPLTLQGGGMYHIAMGAILGISAFTRGQEKIAQANNPDPAPVAPVMMAQPAAFAPAPTAAPAAFGAPAPHPAAAPAATPGFVSNFNSGATPATTTGFGGKPAPAPHVDPEI